MLDSNAKLVGVVSYITPIGWIVGIVLHSNNRSEFGAFHLRQSLGIFLTSFALGWIPLVGWVLSMVMIAFLIVGLIYAIQDQMKTVPFIGDTYQNLFSSIQ